MRRVWISIFLLTALANCVSQAKELLRGVNFYIIPHSVPGPHAPLDTIKKLNSMRLSDAARVGFTLVRVGVSISPWVGDVSIEQQKRTLQLVDEITEHAANLKVRLIFSLFPDGKNTSSYRIVCEHERYGGFIKALDEILMQLPDLPEVGIEVLNEPPSCGTKDDVEAWFAQQQELYLHVREQKPQITYAVMGDGWGSIDGLLKVDASPYRDDHNVIFTFHYYDPFLYTHQEISWLSPGFYKYVTGLSWPVDDKAKAVLKDSIARVYADPGIDLCKKKQISNDLNKAFTAYEQNGRDEYVQARFDRVLEWARRNSIDPNQILLGEFGVHHPAHNVSVIMWPDAPKWLGRVKSVAQQHGFLWAVWDLDSGFGVLCSDQVKPELCPPYAAALH